MSVDLPAISVRSFAKLNLGLEVLRRREDGYHDLVTILQQVSMHDEFTWHATGKRFEYLGPPEIDAGRDLVRRALALARDRNTWSGTLTLRKHVPVGAGMGGGSSNAATALRLALPDASDDELLAHARQLGSDVPFFLRGGTALATGTGTSLEVVPTPELWFVVVVPDVLIQDKTAAMYRRLTRDDYSDGTRVMDAANSISCGSALPERLPNAFRRLYQEMPLVERVFQLLNELGSVPALSGAGPTVFAVFTGQAEADEVRQRLPCELGQIYVTPTLRQGDDREVATMSEALRGTISA